MFEREILEAEIATIYFVFATHEAAEKLRVYLFSDKLPQITSYYVSTQLTIRYDDSLDWTQKVK